ncbi:SDR family NAD(P)-dependent oxidoreductase [Kiloniella laminariae]|uniref:SDR family NAD(P)-dependent oxidoreductase n=1 Tax=Kiloniella laminariae TaxID=454162 RepID=A0ABT4LHV8_9PROT|nr:SDR family oxidoreductase [Kiloniella laminariae]MCZ4280685.1 SDR family NAD(P)-dependent oxidoreductase [Kiloniella laminariae]
MTELRDKVALITGASKGIGAATALEFARQGVRVVLAARNAAALEDVLVKVEQLGGKAAVISCDVSRYEDVSAAVQLCQEQFGGLDILVNNAGAIDPIARLADSDPELWARAADVNYKGVYYGMHAAIPVMQQRGRGVIINVSSGAATSALEGWSHYCSSKAAALSLTRCADQEYREQGITVIGLSPGTVATDMQVSIKQSGINPVSQLDPSVHVPADWPARAIAWLCTGAAKEYAGTDFVLKDEENRRKIGLI